MELSYKGEKVKLNRCLWKIIWIREREMGKIIQRLARLLEGIDLDNASGSVQNGSGGAIMYRKQWATRISGFLMDQSPQNNNRVWDKLSYKQDKVLITNDYFKGRLETERMGKNREKKIEVEIHETNFR